MLVGAMAKFVTEYLYPRDLGSGSSFGRSAPGSNKLGTLDWPAATFIIGYLRVRTEQRAQEQLMEEEQ